MPFTPPTLPKKPGVYLYKDNKGAIIYVGKAKVLRDRVASYFRQQHEDLKTQQLVDTIADMDFIITGNEQEAFLLESNLIKEHKPKYNVRLKHNKQYAYIHVSADEFPRIATARDVRGNGDFYGPFSSGSARVSLIKTLNRAFKLRSCRTMPKRVCLYYRIGRCSGPCEGHISMTEYNKRVKQAKRYLKGNHKELLADLRTEMKEHSSHQRFERARDLRDTILALESLDMKQSVDIQQKYNQDVFAVSHQGNQSVVTVITVVRGSVKQKKDYPFKDVIQKDELLAQFIVQYYEENEIPSEIIVGDNAVDVEGLEQILTVRSERVIHCTVPQRGIKKQLLTIAEENATFALEGADESVVRLQRALKLPETPKTIECFDISTIQGKYTVASMVRFTNGKPDKSNYRRFRIRLDLSDGPNDFASMQEVVTRRYSGLKKEGKLMPDLIVIDGGKGQLSSAISALRSIEISAPIISLAKREEEIFVPGLDTSIRLSKKDPALQLLQRIRDEAHRFAITYHRLLRDKKTIDNS